VDTRYAAEDWLRDHTRGGARVGWFGQPMYMPRLHGIPATHLTVPPDGSLADRPEYLIVNPEVLLRTGVGGPVMFTRLFEHQAGYSEVWRRQSLLPWWAVLRYDAVFTNGRDDETTNLDNVNPEIVILKRDAE